MVIANAFGVEFPVCNEEQKVRLEAAYKEACEYEDAHPRKDGCSCDLIIDLLAPITTRNASITAAWIAARDIFEKKQRMNAILQMMEMAEMDRPAGNA